MDEFLGLTPSEWYWAISFAVVMGTAHHSLVRLSVERCMRHAAYVKHENLKKKRGKEHSLALANLSTEVVRSRLMVDAWILRNPRAGTRGGKYVLYAHLKALRAYHRQKGTLRYFYPESVEEQYDDPYWRAVWHVTHSGCKQTIPPCPLERM